MIRIIPAEKTEEDGKLVMRWRNDETTRRMSFNSKIKKWETFKDEYMNDYFENIPLFITLDDKKIAFVSLIHHTEKSFKIGINVSKECRGKGLGVLILLKTTEYVRKKYAHIEEIIAEIKEENIASKKVFERADYVFRDKNIRGDSKIVFSTYVYKMKDE